MPIFKNLRISTFRAILFGRWEPVIAVLSVSACIHGLWLLFPGWQTTQVSITGASREYERGLAYALIVVALTRVISLMMEWRSLVRHSTMAMFLLWGFLAWLAVIAFGFANILWIPYMTIMIVSAFSYLNISLGVDNGD